MDNFVGNVFVFMPCYKSDSKKYAKSKEQLGTSSKFEQSYLDIMEERSKSEVVRKVSQNVSRRAIGRYRFACFDAEENRPHGKLIHIGSSYETTHVGSGLVVVTVCLKDFNGPITELLDRVSRQSLEVVTNGQDEESFEFSDFEDILNEKFGLAQVGVSRVCLSTRNVPDKEILPYCFANETYLSSEMEAQVIGPEYADQANDNLAEYDSSDIYAGARTVLRLDRAPMSDDMESPTIWAESKLLFIIEALMMKEAAIARSNNHVIKTIESRSRVTLNVIEGLSNQFGKTMPFWNIDSFKYITAQSLADKLNGRFNLDKKLRNYFDNQRFLEHRISVRYAQQERSEDAILYIIAILLFVFQGTPFLYSLILSFYEGFDFGPENIAAIGGSAGITISLIVVLLVILKRKRGYKDFDIS